MLERNVQVIDVMGFMVVCICGVMSKRVYQKAGDEVSQPFLYVFFPILLPLLFHIGD